MMDGVGDLVVWLREQLDEDEASTRTLLYWAQQTILTLQDPKLLGKHIPGWHDWPKVERMCRVRLAEVDAKRRIVGEHSPHRNGACPVCWRETTRSCLRQDYPCLTLRLLALPYADRPGYRQEWAP